MKTNTPLSIADQLREIHLTALLHARNAQAKGTGVSYRVVLEIVKQIEKIEAQLTGGIGGNGENERWSSKQSTP